MARLVEVVAALLLALGACASVHGRAGEGRQSAVEVAGRNNVTCMLVFGDSTVDPGNNNRLRTNAKANFPPYGKDFFHGRPTGRFCDGRLATDFIAEALGISTSIPAFLDPNLSLEELEHGVSFASASSGYDELTAANSKVLSFSKQIEYLMHYKLHLRKLVGPVKSEQIMKNAIGVVSAGTNDFIANYYFGTNRSEQFTVAKYEDYLITLTSNYIERIHRVGVTRFAVAGIPPMGCLPIVKTFYDLSGSCLKTFNDVAASFNSKLVAQLSVLEKKLGVRAVYLDIYQVILDATRNPKKYGFTETEKGCCGSGTIEMGETCKGQTTCKDPSRYMYWDSVHPTEKLYRIVAEEVMRGVAKEIMG